MKKDKTEDEVIYPILNVNNWVKEVKKKIKRIKDYYANQIILLNQENERLEARLAKVEKKLKDYYLWEK